MQERRQHQRRRTYLGGQAAFGQRYCAQDCLVRNLSQNGARLIFSDHVLIPDEFDLMIPHKGDSRRARIVWRYQAYVGVQFLEYDHGRRSVGAARRIRALKEQNAALARRIADLSEPAY
jgi:PilZ domain